VFELTFHGPAKLPCSAGLSFSASDRYPLPKALESPIEFGWTALRHRSPSSRSAPFRPGCRLRTRSSQTGGDLPAAIRSESLTNPTKRKEAGIAARAIAPSGAILTEQGGHWLVQPGGAPGSGTAAGMAQRRVLSPRFRFAGTLAVGQGGFTLRCNLAAPEGPAE